MNITGTVEKVLPVQEFPSGFYKQTLLVKTGDRYPQIIPIDFHKEKTEALNGIGPGNKVKVDFDLRGREWNERHFLEAAGWKVESQGQPAHTAQQQAEPSSQPDPDDEDIPF